MTTDANDNDPHVSETYRALATETTPPDLDKKILSMAADSADTRQTGFGLSRAWFRPIAWAATIGLSLAFVLEMSQLNDVEEPIVQTESNEMLEERVVGDQVAAEPADTSRQQLQQTVDKRADTAPAAGAAPASVSEDFAADDILLLREAEDQARARSGPARTEVTNSPLAAFAVKKEQAGACEAGVRHNASSWYACIEDLREKDLDELAALELEALFEEFPDFEIPDANK